MSEELSQKEIQKLRKAGAKIDEYLQKTLLAGVYRKVNRLIEIEILLTEEDGK